MNLELTKHARTRCQQRGMPIEAIEFIFMHGKSINTHQDKKYFCTKKILSKLKHIEKEVIRKFDKFILNTAIVCNDNRLITVMRINKRIR
tara:strand:- start:73 stop:342 length:270 start_codon:yes stop_codon:yes gene_type:complete